ncbi:MAG: 2-oxoglutarate dehydrogenase complex dihydrolipoyllysine-residue succinyltransferase [Bacteroidales bacterium]|nr:2-oxoglutarate dehydrogenase complex dihydrolipoyllysine-residue succinyltransferase [Bacteroidales bacterium]MCF8456917.1 2-oxoglutarate dehydrogenase complex dihydrolipoyllysine-residue succinyltransferase [Bacteroidales bacterium]
MIIEITIPSPGESINEVEIANWLVEDGDIVEKDQEIAEVESDKATLPLIAPESGKIKIVAPVGETIAVGSLACSIDTSFAGEVKSKPAEVKADALIAKTVEAKKESAPTVESKKPTSNTFDQVKISPVARKMMEEGNLSVEEVINGLRRISKSDIEAIQSLPKDAVHVQGFTAQEPSRDVEKSKMTSLRKKLSKRLVAVKNETAMLTTFNEVDMTAVMALRKTYQNKFVEKHGIKLGFMSFFTKAVTEALKLHPSVNAMIDGDELVFPKFCDIGIAVQTPKGLMVPVIRNAESMNLAEIEAKLMELAGKARAGRISLDDITGGTFTITNGGVFGSLLSTPILNPPQSGILGMHNIIERPVAINGQVVVRPMMYIALSYDHRVIDGKDSVGFLVKVKEFIESPQRMLYNGVNPDNLLLGI